MSHLGHFYDTLGPFLSLKVSVSIDCNRNVHQKFVHSGSSSQQLLNGMRMNR